MNLYDFGHSSVTKSGSKFIKLRYHKKKHNFINTHSYKCLCNQGIEDTNHFLLCPVVLLEQQP